jgi:hypothetical protein
MGMRGLCLLCTLQWFWLTHGIFQERLLSKHDPNQYCTDRKRKSHLLSDGAFITRENSTWLMRKDRSMEYRPHSCRLKRFNVGEAKVCLNRQHLLFIGDSLSRFQYLSLIYFIEHGRWLSRFRMDPNCTHHNEHGIAQCRQPGELNLNDPHNRNYKTLHLGLGGDYFHGKLECQCFRGKVEKSVENMFYESNTTTSSTTDMGTSSNPSGQTETVPGSIKLTYLSDNIVFPMKGWKRNHCSHTSSCQMSESDWEDYGQKRWDYEYYDDNPLLYDHLSSHMIPDVNIALVNRGLWATLPTNTTTMAVIFKKLSQIIQKNSGRCFWKGTTLPMEPKMTELLGYSPSSPTNFTLLERHIRSLSHHYHCESYDLSHVTSAFVEMLGTEEYSSKNNVTWSGGAKSRYEITDVYIDRVHFQPWVYEEFNQILLNVLC